MSEITRKLQIPLPERLALFREGTERQARRNAQWSGERDCKDRGWTREELYDERCRPGESGVRIVNPFAPHD